MMHAGRSAGAVLAKSRRRASARRAKPQTRDDALLLTRTIRELSAIRADVLQSEGRFGAQLHDAHPTLRQSARNLVHYVALRSHDIRPLQERLAAFGLSSLGRTESHVVAGIDAVGRVLCQMSGQERADTASPSPAIGFNDGQALLRAHTEALLGPRPPERGVRIMVTVPREAASDYELVRDLLAHGMDCMRINCAHDDAEVWVRMVANLERAKKELGRECRVLMDLAGPKLRTGPIDPTTQIVRWKPRRDLRGMVVAPARIWVTAAERPLAPPEPADGCLRLPASSLRWARRGERVEFTDLRGKSRCLELAASAPGGRWALARQGAYLNEGCELVVGLTPARGRRAVARRVVALPYAPSAAAHYITVKPGDTLMVTRSPLPGHPAAYDRRGRRLSPAKISCTLPEVFGDVRRGQRIWFDDGKIGGVVEAASAAEVRVRITVARREGEKLRADKGINLPDSRLRTPPLTDKDIADLDFVVEHADLVGLSFVRTPDDVRQLQLQLERLGATRLGIVLKIETTTAFEHLPSLLLAAMRGERVGVMIARGDLAVECGYERLAEIQEEILWFCEAAHVPVIWATQVLESLAKKGVPSRAEVTDAAMGERAECVMLNKGPHLVDAVRVLDDILRRMEAHQSKKSARLRRLRLSVLAGA